MGWELVAIYGVLGLLLAASPQAVFRSRGDAARDARLMGGLRGFGSLLLHLAAFCAFMKLAGAL